MIEFIAIWLGFLVFGLGVSALSWLTAKVLDWTIYMGDNGGLFYWVLYVFTIFIPGIVLSGMGAIVIAMAVMG